MVEDVASADAVAELERQARRLDTAYSVIQAVHEELALDHMVASIAQQLVEVAGFSGAEIRLNADFDGFHVEQSASAGTPPATQS